MARPLGQKLIPKTVTFDDSPANIPSDVAFFMKGVEMDWINETVAGGQNAGEIKPMESNYLYCSTTLPRQGENTVIGFKLNEESFEGYVVVHNSAGFHFIYRMLGIHGGCEKVYDFCPINPFLPPNQTDISALITDNPEDYFSEGRIDIKSLCRYLPGGGQELYKELVLVNKKVPNLRIAVEDSIVTDSFTTPFFTPKNDCCGDRCRLIKVGVPTPIDDIKIVPIIPTAEDFEKQNTLFNKLLKFRFKHSSGWNQASEHGKISEAYIANPSACTTDPQSNPRCLWIETKMPCPEITEVILEVQSCILTGDTGTVNGSTISDWKEYATFKLYNQDNPDLRWFERVLKDNNDEFEIFNDGKNIRFKFCNDRECKTIAKVDIRDQNPVPLTSGTVAAIGRGLIYGDNENDLGPMIEQDKKDFSFELIAPDASCKVERIPVKIYAVIHNPFDDQNNGVYTFGGKLVFGGFAPDALNDFEQLVGNDEGTGGYGQFFPPGVTGFRAIMAGTNFQATSKQLVWDRGTGLLTDPALGTDIGTIKNFMNGIRPGVKVLIQEFDFGYLPKGNYVFRVLGHNDTENLPRTSTYYCLNFSWNTYKIGYLPGGFGVPNVRHKEMRINATGDSYNSIEGGNDLVAVILDLTKPSQQSGNNNGTSVMRGYVYEDRTGRQPMEFCSLPQPSGYIGCLGTDYNGFYFLAKETSSGENNFGLSALYKCAPQEIAVVGVIGSEGTYKHPDIFAVDKFADYVTAKCNRWIVKGSIKECGTNAGIGGIGVVLTNCAPVYTNSNGDFAIVAHYNLAPYRAEYLIFSPTGNCDILDCNCNPILLQAPVLQPGCTNCIEIAMNYGVFYLKTIVYRGFEHGSKVPIGIEAHDWLGRHTDIQDKFNWVVQMPSEQQQGHSLYSKIKINLPALFSSDFCKRFKHLTFFYGQNPEYVDFLEWAADKVEFVDSAGNVSPYNISKVKIWYRSLNEYNKIRGLNTNTNWKFLNAITDSKGQVIDAENKVQYNTQLNDVVEFIQNADMTYLPPGILANVQYDKSGQYFLVDYSPNLSVLKDGVRFKLKRPFNCEVNKAYYEEGPTIYFCVGDCRPRDVNGDVIYSITLNGFNSYMVPRQMPVVKDIKVNDVASTLITSTVYPFSFEHHSPSDVWGDHCFSGGRIGYKNPYERKRCDRNQLLLTGALNSANDGAVNYLHYFSLSEDFSLDEQGWGGIKAIIVRNDGQIMLICDNTTFSLRYNDDRAIVTQDGYIKLPTNQKFSRPEKDDGFSFGVQFKDLNTIRRNGSLVMWLDSEKCAVVMHNFANGKDVSAGIKSWLTAAIKSTLKNKDIFFHACFDNRGNDKRYILTKFNKKLDQYVNNEMVHNIELNETISFSLKEFLADGKGWREMLHYTPEYFGMMYGELKDTQFFSFRKGLPYAHHNAVTPATKYLNYFGIQCTPMIGVVANGDNTKLKSFLSNSVYCFEQLFIAEIIETSMGQESKLREGAYEFGEGFWSGGFGGDTKYLDASDPRITDGITDGDQLYGKWMKVLYIAYNKDGTPYNGKFFRLTAFIITAVSRENSGNDKQG